MSCIDKTSYFSELLLPYAEGGLNSLTREEVSEHLAECSYCASKVNEICAFLKFIPLIDKNIWGKKSECPSADELIKLTDSPSKISGDNIKEIKQHLLECFRCNDLLKRLVELRKQMQHKEFETMSLMPEKLKKRISTFVDNRVRSGAAKGEPVIINLHNVLKNIPSDTIYQLTHRKIPQEQRKIPFLEKEIYGILNDKSGKPIRRECISLIRNNKILYQIRTSPLGAFYFKNLSQGFYEINVRNNKTLMILKD